MPRRRVTKPLSTPTGPVTAQDIADHLGVARPTVSTILSGAKSNTRVSEKLRQRVLATAEQLGYRPNTAAQAIRRGTFKAIGIVSSADAGRGGMPWPTLYALQTRAAEHDMHLSMGIIPDQNLTDPAGLPKVVREWCVDGLLISYTADIPPVMLDHIRRHRIPAIWMNIKLDHDCVYLDDFGGARGATEILLEMGHRRILFHGPGPAGAHYSVNDRYQGYATTMQRAGLTPQPLFRQDPTPRDRPQQADSLHPLIACLQTKDRPTAVLTIGGEADVLFACHQAGLKLPEDLSLISMTVGSGPVLGMKCAEMRLHAFGLGWRSFNVLQQKIRRPDEPLPPVSIYCTFDAGQTLARPKP